MTEKIHFERGPEGDEELELRQAAGGGAEIDAGLERALAEFRSSVHAWSEAATARVRISDSPARRRSWRLAAGWALGCALVAGGVTGGIIEYQQQQASARMMAGTGQQAQQQQAATTQEQAQPRDRIQEPGLMAKVDSDTAQEVPDAMQPLAQLMEDGGSE